MVTVYFSILLIENQQSPRPLMVVVKLVVLVGLLYLFISSLGLLASSFRLLGGKTASKSF